MGDAYQFSESSLSLLEDCIQAAGQPGIDWMVLLKSNTTLEKRKIFKKEDSVSSNASTQILDYEDNVTDKAMEDMSRQASEEAIENILANLEVEPNQLDYLMEQCDRYDNLLPILAGKLTSACVEAICNELFISRPNCIEKYYVEFLAVYLKRGSTFRTVELLISAHVAHPEAFKSLIVALLSSNTPILVLDNFFTTMDNSEQSQILQALSMTQLPPEAFIQHLNCISYLYKSSQKTAEIQSFILNCLTSSAEACCKDKNYGKFLLTYFQALKESNTPINKHELEQLLNIHETTFARPCLSLLNNYK